MPFESVVQPLTGSITAHVHDPSGIVPETTIVRATDPWQIHVLWSISGLASEFIIPPMTWNVRCFLESMGTGPETPIIPTANVAAQGGLAQNYDVLINVPAFPVLGNPAFSGLYRLVTVLTLRTSPGGAPLPIAGYDEGNMMQFYLP
jgi:hypothetical protein